jgi:hypothetical protein
VSNPPERTAVTLIFEVEVSVKNDGLTQDAGEDLGLILMERIKASLHGLPWVLENHVTEQRRA